MLIDVTINRTWAINSSKSRSGIRLIIKLSGPEVGKKIKISHVSRNTLREVCDRTLASIPKNTRVTKNFEGSSGDPRLEPADFCGRAGRNKGGLEEV